MNPPSFSCLWRFANMHGNVAVWTITGKAAQSRSLNPPCLHALLPGDPGSAPGQPLGQGSGRRPRRTTRPRYFPHRFRGESNKVFTSVAGR
jgi:hypothetical protein